MIILSSIWYYVILMVEFQGINGGIKEYTNHDYLDLLFALLP
jgi:hypothetical protein